MAAKCAAFRAVGETPACRPRGAFHWSQLDLIDCRVEAGERKPAFTCVVVATLSSSGQVRVLHAAEQGLTQGEKKEVQKAVHCVGGEHSTN